MTSGKISLTAHKIKRMVKQKKVEVEAKEPLIKVNKTEDKTDKIGLLLCHSHIELTLRLRLS